MRIFLRSKIFIGFDLVGENWEKGDCKKLGMISEIKKN